MGERPRAGARVKTGSEAGARGKTGPGAGTRAKTGSGAGARGRAGPGEGRREDIASVMAMLAEAGTAQNRKIYARHGAAEPMFGVSYKNLGLIRKQVGVDHELALELWDTGNHDARVLALQTAEADAVTPETARRWAGDATNYILAEALGGLCARTRWARALSDAWRDDPGEWPASIGWFIVACTAEDPEVWTAAELWDLVRQIEAEIGARPNRVRHEMNGILIAVALRDGNLRRSALAAARRIGPVAVDHGQTGCKTPEVAGYVERTLAHRAAKAARAKRPRPG